MVIIGLGNPGAEYENTRHNVGRSVVQMFAKKIGTDDFEFDKKANALVVIGKAGKTRLTLVLPETFMNKSGNSAKFFVKNQKQAKDLVVVHDDLDLPLGKIKISYNKSSGGHKGVESVMRAIKTEEFIRVRIGISGETASGKIKKPSGDALVNNFIVAPFKPKEILDLKKSMKLAVEALSIIAEDGYEKAMMEIHSR